VLTLWLPSDVVAEHCGGRALWWPSDAVAERRKGRRVFDRLREPQIATSLVEGTGFHALMVEQAAEVRRAILQARLTWSGSF